MAGFKNGVLCGKNADYTQFDGPTSTSSESNGLVTNGQLWIGSTALNAGQTHINVGSLTSPGGTLTIGYSSPNITIDLAGGAAAIERIAVQTGTSPILPAGGTITMNGATVAAGTNPVRTDGTGANTLAVEVQISQALAAADATKIGLSNFSSTDFSVAATGFVTLSTTGAGKTITGDSGGALSPTANNWNILGLSGSKTSGSGSTLTVKSPPFSQVGASATSSLNTGEFVTAAVTRTLPASAGLADGDLFIYVCTTASALVIQAVSAQKIRIGSLISSAAGTATSTAIGDSLTLRFDATDGFFYSVGVVGTWTLA
jgi:hypothetical protein